MKGTDALQALGAVALAGWAGLHLLRYRLFAQDRMDGVTAWPWVCIIIAGVLFIGPVLRSMPSKKGKVC